ncbi:MAG: hypothetical protein EBY92_07485, partial [Actinobacteria bacterium]|nr:hypothetical protein [Actinomycetota bacterium]
MGVGLHDGFGSERCEGSQAVECADVDATALYVRFHAEHRLSHDDCRAMCTAAQIINTPEQSKRLNERREPMVIIAASGMATGGRVVHHL